MITCACLTVADLPRAIKVQLLKFFASDRRDNMIMFRTLPAMPTRETMMMYGMEICMRMLRIVVNGELALD